MRIKNYEEVKHELAKRIRQIETGFAQYDEDVYLYVDDAMEGTVSIFGNPGGNSWLQGDGTYHIYHHRQDFDNAMEYLHREYAGEWCGDYIGLCCRSLDLDEDQTTAEVKEYYSERYSDTVIFEWEADEENESRTTIDISDFDYYLWKNYEEKIIDWYKNWMDEDVDWEEKAEYWLNDKCVEPYEITFQDILNTYDCKMTEISTRFAIPYRTLQNWKNGVSTPPQYVLVMLNKLLARD